MSEFHVKVVRVGELSKHPNADSLSLTKVHDYPVIVRTGDYRPGDLAVYVPVDSVVPATETFAFLAEHRRIRAKRLRGIFSMGLLVPAPAGLSEGDDARGVLGIEKYEPPEPLTMGGENERDPGFIPIYTDIEGLRRWPNALQSGEDVVLTEKIHGANGRFLFHEGRLWVGSHKCIKKPDPTNMWWRIAAQYDLENKLQRCPGIVVYGEVFGAVQDLKYGTKNGELRFALFDALNVATREYLHYQEFLALARALELPTVPELYSGPWSEDHRCYAEGPSTIADHVREGFVVRPRVERFSEELGGRCVLKLIGEGYMLKGKQ
ncbi:MAG: RNA ligase (ATP) [Salinibacterium sp.]|nr:MAG: RNA ligase (ATP) [Salinibacterium sp.]